MLHTDTHEIIYFENLQEIIIAYQLCINTDIRFSIFFDINRDLILSNRLAAFIVIFDNNKEDNV
jgi:hypothetical protein